MCEATKDRSTEIVQLFLNLGVCSNVPTEGHQAQMRLMKSYPEHRNEKRGSSTCPLIAPYN